MPAFPIEIMNFGNPSFKAHEEVISELNEIQNDIVFLLPPERYKLWAAPFEREQYKTSYIWEKLRDYKKECKGFHPFILAIVHGYLKSDNLGNLFGSRNEKENIAVVTTYGWEQHFAPPSLSVYLTYYFIRYSMNFICPEIKNHAETRECFFDKKINKEDIRLSMDSGKICDPCRNIFEKSIDGHTYNSVLNLVQHLKDKYMGTIKKAGKLKVFIGSSSEGIKIAENIQLGLEYSVEVTIWSQGVFGLSKGNLENLVNASTEYDYAILVLTPDDLTTKRGQEENSPRDNVLFELGLFMGALGRQKTFMVHCRDIQLDLPSDLAGVSAATFANRDDNNLEAAVGPVCTRLKQEMGIS
jgi:predicted nucleotide-binding protein